MSFSNNNVPGRGTDAFGRFPVSNPVTLFDWQAQYDKGGLLWEEAVVNTGSTAHAEATADVTLSVAADGDSVIRQTRQYQRYQPGKSQMILMTGAFNNDGSLYIVKRSKITGSVVDTKVAEANWSWKSSVSGQGVYNVDIDPSKAQIFMIDFEYLGVGSVRTGFVIDGLFIPLHVFNHANSGSSVYMTTANLPLRYEIVSDGGTIYKRIGYFDDDNGVFFEHQSSGTSGDMKAICAVAISEGGFEESRGIPFSVSTGATPVAVTTRRPILSIRPKATFNSIVNRGLILPTAVQLFASSEAALVELVYNGTLSGSPSWTSANADSITEYDTAATGISGGIVIGHAYIPAASQGNLQAAGVAALGLASRLPLTLDIAGANPINLSVVATKLTGTTSNVSAAISWRETK